MTTTSNPYPGAKPLTAGDPGLLHGRDDLLGEFEHLVGRYPVIEVAGPSGVGKSSFIGAGLCGRLSNEGNRLVRPFAAWSQLPDTAGTVFYAESLRAALRNGEGDSQGPIDAFLADPALVAPEDDPFGFVLAVDRAFGQNLVVVFDQLEELLRDDPHLGRRFLANVRDVAARLPDGFTQVVSLREEYVAHLKIIEEGLDPSLWYVKLISEVSAEVVPALVTSPLDRPDVDVAAGPDLVASVVDAWLLARPDTSPNASREVTDESRPGLLHLQAFLYSMYELLDPRPGTVLTSELVADALGFAWPTTDAEALAFFADRLERYVDIEMDGRVSELVGDPPDPHREQRADETRRIAAALPEHLSSAGYKLVRGTDGLAATVLTQLRDLHSQLSPEQRQRELAAAAGDGTPQFPPGMADGSDLGQQVKSLAGLLARWCRQDHHEDPRALAAAAIVEFPGLRDWGDDEIAAGRMYRSARGEDSIGSAILTACELVVTYERALRWLETSCIVRMTPSRTGERMVAIVHDGFGAALLAWASKTLDDPRVEAALPVAVTGKQVFYRPNTSDEDARLDRSVLRSVDGFAWIGCNVTAFFDGLTFRNCDLRSTLFMNCRFRDVVFEDCATHGLLFIACQFEGGFTIRSTGGPNARPGAAELKTVSFNVGCVVRDGALRFEGLSGYGVFLDAFAGAWEVDRCSFSHLVVAGNPSAPQGAGPGRIVDSPELSHVVVRGNHPHPVSIVGAEHGAGAGVEAPLDAPAYLQAPGVDITYPKA